MKTTTENKIEVGFMFIALMLFIFVIWAKLDKRFDDIEAKPCISKQNSSE